MGQTASAIAEGCAVLGAGVTTCELPDGDDAAQCALDALGDRGGALDLLVIDAASIFAGTCTAGAVAMGRCLQASWEITHALANAAWIEHGRAGRLLFIAPAGPSASVAEGAPAAALVELAPYARATRAGLENLARTLSIEWSRHPITTVCIAPAPDTSAGDIAALVAYLASPAGAYFSGCRLDLDAGVPSQRLPNRDAHPSASRASERAL
jgi:NAD(P)-dependent dehydrogenase (short-subunit alcohol dehydrogenase family)